MATLIPANQPSNVEATYEDMFKEIARKLYGEETGNGLHTLGTPVAHIATTGPTAPEGERSFTTLIDRNLPSIQYGQQQQPQQQNPQPTNQQQQQPNQQPQTTQHNNPNNNNNNHPNSTTLPIPSTVGLSNFKTEDHLTTAFGLAALMHNGFTNPGNIIPKIPNPSIINNSNIPTTLPINLNNSNNNNTPANSVDSSEQQQHHIPQLQNHQQQSQEQQQHRWNNNTNEDLLQQWQNETKPIINFQTPIITPPKPPKYSEVFKQIEKNRNSTSEIQFQPGTSTQQPTIQNIPHPKKKIQLQQNLQNQQQQSPNTQQSTTVQKRYSCSHCPYSTDRRDLYTRHENIHKDEKPFQCYACLKQFNRADHVKKHFLRMHRELTYDISKTRRNVNNNNNNNNTSNINTNSNNNNSSPSPSIDQKPLQLFNSGNTSTTTIGTNNQQLTNDHFLNNQKIQASSSSIAQTIESVATATESLISSSMQIKEEKLSNDDKSPNKSMKPQKEKRFTCCYCPWSGADKWGLKRHLNTHTKPFVCMLCDYKAARSERLATHVLKVHNKKACNKCSFLADSQEEYQNHLAEVHQLKMEAISRNTTSVAQDFHNAGGVVKYNNNNNSINKNNNFCYKTTPNLNSREATIPSTMQFQQQQVNLNISNGYEKNIKQNDNNFINNINYEENNFNFDNFDTSILTQKFNQLSNEQKKAMLDHLNKSPPAFLLNNHQSNSNIMNEFHSSKNDPNDLVLNFSKNKNINSNNINNINYQHRLESKQNDKENTNSIFSTMEYENLNKLNIQFHNYIKNIINKYYAETPLLYSSTPTGSASSSSSTSPILSSSRVSSTSPISLVKNDSLQKSFSHRSSELSSFDDDKLSHKSETENYIEYLKNKGDITLIVQPKKPKVPLSYKAKEPEKPSIEISLAPKKRFNELYTNSLNSLNKINNTDSVTTKIMPNQSQSFIQKNDVVNEHKTQNADKICIKRKSCPTNLQEICQNISKLPKLEILPLSPAHPSSHSISIEQSEQISKQSYCDASRKRKQAQPKKLLYPDENNISTMSVIAEVQVNNKNDFHQNTKLQNIFNNNIKNDSQIDYISKKDRIINQISKIRDKHMRKLVDEKRICVFCNKYNNCKQKFNYNNNDLNISTTQTDEMIFPYHTKRSLRLHQLWKHKNSFNRSNFKCRKCKKFFLRKYSLTLHYFLMKH